MSSPRGLAGAGGALSTDGMIQVWRKREDDPFEFDLEFEVVVSDEQGETRHHVTLARAAYTPDGGSSSPGKPA